MRLVHITDPHLTAPHPEGFAELWPKRWSGYRSWRRKRQYIHQRDVLDLLTNAVQNEHSQQILLSGDLTQIGLPAEIKAARDWLDSLAPADQVSLAPGNHDVYASDSWPAIERYWAEYVGIGTDAGETFPVVRQLQDQDTTVRITTLCSATPTPLFMASGHLDQGQLDRLRQLPDAPDAFHCTLIHHPPLPGMIGRRKGLDNAEALAELWRCSAPHLVLHGHVHKNSVLVDETLGTLVCGTASASSRDSKRPAAYRVFDITREGSAWRVYMTLKELHVGRGEIEIAQVQSWRLAAGTPPVCA